MSFTKIEPQSHRGKSNEWLTPLWIIKSLGDFDMDPCGFGGHPTARRIICPPTNGLEERWEGRIWLNPPYGRQTKYWLKRLESHGNGIALVFARTDTKWFQDLNFSAVNFLRGRIKFLNNKFEELTNAGVPSCLISFGDNNISVLNKIDGVIMKRLYPLKNC